MTQFPSCACRTLRRVLRFTREASLSDRVLKPLHPSDSANDGSPRSRFRPLQRVPRSIVEQLMRQIMHYGQIARRAPSSLQKIRLRLTH